MGSKGRDLLRTQDANQVLDGDINGNGVADRLDYARNIDLGAVRPYGVFGDRNITLWDHSGKSTYHSLQTQVRSRVGRSQVQASYTLSRTRANISLDNSDGNLSKHVTALDVENPDVDWGRPYTDRTHIFNASVVCLLPSLENESSLVKGRARGLGAGHHRGRRLGVSPHRLHRERSGHPRGRSFRHRL